MKLLTLKISIAFIEFIRHRFYFYTEEDLERVEMFVNFSQE